jgi:hypothetical protein
MSTAVVLKHSQMTPITRAVRAYVAPINRNTDAFVPFDPAAQGQFDLDAPITPFLDLGWIENFQRTAPTKYEVVRSGPRGVASAQYRSQVEAQIDFDLPSWGKLQMAIAGGNQQLNVLAIGQFTAPQASGGTPLPAVYPLDGSNSAELVLSADALANFSAGDMVAVDADYTGSVGYLGAGIPGTFLAAPLDAASHVDLIRRFTFNVARVLAKTQSTILLSPILAAGYWPGFGVQRVAAFLDREGGSYFQEWSALFVVPSECGGRVCYFYPRVQTASSAAEKLKALSGPLFNNMLHASLRALPTVDPNDGETVLCYRSYFPAPTAVVF